MGRKTKLTEEVQKNIIDFIENGSTFKDAAILSGISENTFHNWVNRGREAKNGKFKDFYISMEEAVAKAKAINKQRHLNNINQDKTWQSSAWVLERRYREEYGKYENINMNSKVKAEVNTTAKNTFTLSDEELEEILTIDDNQDEFTEDL